MLLDNHYGPDRRVQREVELLSREHLEVAIIAWDRRTAPGSAVPALPTGVRLMRVNVPAPAGGGARSLLALVRFAMLAWRLHRDVICGAGLIVVHDIYLLPFGVVLRRLLGTRLVYDAHEDYAVMERGRLPEWLLSRVADAEASLARRAALVVVPGRVRQRRWTAAGLPPPVVLSNCGPTERHQGAARSVRDEWDLIHSGTIDDTRRPDLLLDLARNRPELRVVIIGKGRAASKIAAQAAELPNVDFLGWVDDPENLLRRSRAVYYGLDPDDAYAAVACPNNLYQALRADRPLIFFCGGEPAELAKIFRIGFRIEANVGDLTRSVDLVRSGDISWEFAAARRAIETVDSARAYVCAMVATVRDSPAGRQRQGHERAGQVRNGAGDDATIGTPAVRQHGLTFR
jgi:glycosyltransferase involved in cell wall biosynthesis